MEAQQPTLELSTELKPGKVVAGFRLGKQIGFGGFAKVFTAEHVDTRRKAAVKCVRKPKMKTRTSDRKPTTYKQPSPSEVNLLRTYNECRVLELLSHDNIVGLIDWVETKRHVYIITELAEDGDLLEYIRLFGPLSEKQLCNVFVSLVDALRYAHSHGFAHLDLKPENVLLNDDRVLLADWGFATPVKTTPSHLRWVGTRGYAAPEVVNQDLDHFDARRADCWSLGVTLYALACGKMAFDTRRPDVERLITSGEYAMPEHLPAPLRAVIAGLLEVDPAKRLTLTQLRASELYALATPPPAPRKSRTAAARSLPRSRVITTPVANTPIALAVPHTPDGSESDALPAPPPSREGQGLRDLPARPALLYGHALDEALIELDVLAEDDLPPEVAADERKALRKLEKQLEKDQRKFAEPSEAGAKLGSVLGLARRLMGMSNPKKERR